MDSSPSDPFPDDDPLQALIGKQLRTLYDSVLSEPIPEKFVELLSKLDEVPGPDDQASDAASTDDR